MQGFVSFLAMSSSDPAPLNLVSLLLLHLPVALGLYCGP